MYAVDFTCSGIVCNGNLAACHFHVEQFCAGPAWCMLLLVCVCVFYEMVSARKLPDETQNRRNACVRGQEHMDVILFDRIIRRRHTDGKKDNEENGLSDNSFGYLKSVFAEV